MPLPDRGARVAIVQKKLRSVQRELQQQHVRWSRMEFVPAIWFNMSYKTTVDQSDDGMPPLAELCETIALSEVLFCLRPCHSARCTPLTCCTASGREAHVRVPVGS